MGCKPQYSGEGAVQIVSTAGADYVLLRSLNVSDVYNVGQPVPGTLPYHLDPSKIFGVLEVEAYDYNG
jgi:hypothetical protein